MSDTNKLNDKDKLVLKNIPSDCMRFNKHGKLTSVDIPVLTENGDRTYYRLPSVYVAETDAHNQDIWTAKDYALLQADGINGKRFDVKLQGYTEPSHTSNLLLEVKTTDGYVKSMTAGELADNYRAVKERYSNFEKDMQLYIDDISRDLLRHTEAEGRYKLYIADSDMISHPDEARFGYIEIDGSRVSVNQNNPDNINIDLGYNNTLMPVYLIDKTSQSSYTDMMQPMNIIARAHMAKKCVHLAPNAEAKVNVYELDEMTGSANIHYHNYGTIELQTKDIAEVNEKDIRLNLWDGEQMVISGSSIADNVTTPMGYIIKQAFDEFDTVRIYVGDNQRIFNSQTQSMCDIEATDVLSKLRYFKDLIHQKQLADSLDGQYNERYDNASTIILDKVPVNLIQHDERFVRDSYSVNSMALKLPTASISLADAEFIKPSRDDKGKTMDGFVDIGLGTKGDMHSVRIFSDMFVQSWYRQEMFASDVKSMYDDYVYEQQTAVDSQLPPQKDIILEKVEAGLFISNNDINKYLGVRILNSEGKQIGSVAFDKEVTIKPSERPNGEPIPGKFDVNLGKPSRGFFHFGRNKFSGISQRFEMLTPRQVKELFNAGQKAYMKAMNQERSAMLSRAFNAAYGIETDTANDIEIE